jgi:ATP-dependent metalloprotease FtsH
MFNKIQEGYFNPVRGKVDVAKRENAKKPAFTSENNSQKLVKPTLDHLKANFISFKGAISEKGLDLSNVIEYTSNFSADLSTRWDKAIQIAKLNSNKELSTLHLLKASFEDTKRAIERGEKDSTAMLKVCGSKYPDMLDDPEKRGFLSMIFEEYISFIDEAISSLGQSSADNAPSKVSKGLESVLKNAYQNELESGNVVVTPSIQESTVLQSILTSSDTKAQQVLGSIFVSMKRDLKELDEMNNVVVSKQANRTNTGGGELVPIDAYRQPNPVGSVKAVNQLSNESPVNLVDIEHYSNKAKTLGALVSAGKDSIFTHDLGAMPELLAHSFTKMLHNRGFKDLNPQNTEVTIIDTPQAFKSGKNPVSEINSIVSNAVKSPDKKHVVFIKDFDQALMYMFALGQQKPASDPSKIFRSGGFAPNVHVVGLMQNNMFSNLTNTEHATIFMKELADTVSSRFEKVSLGAPSPDLAKEILKQEPALMATITGDYSQQVIVAPEAIDRAVDLAIKTRKGSMPGKALDLLKFVMAAKANNTGNNFGSITIEDVNTFSKGYPDLKQSPESGDGTFSVVHDTGIKMKDVGGASQAKEVVNEILEFLDPQKVQNFNKVGATMPRGILLHGSPGNGKTYLAKAIAGEASVPFISVSGSEFVEKYVGVGAARVRELFDFAADQAKANDKNTAFIFIDEFDSLGRKRGGDSNGGNREAEQTLNQLLVSMDGLNKYNNVNIVVIAATNRPDLLDDAVKRPGRFDRQVAVPNPSNDVEARYEILAVHARNKKIEGDKEQILKEVAESTSGQSGAGLADIVNRAAIIAAKDGRDTITINDFVEAKLESVAGKIHKIKKTPWNKEIVVTHECGHALTRQVMNDIAQKPWQRGSQIDVITTDSRGEYGGAVYFKPDENTEVTFERLMGNLATGYGGYAVEKALFGISGSWGISGDLKQNTEEAKRAVMQMGMGPHSRLLASADDPFMQDMMKDEIRKDIKLLTNNASVIADKIVDFHREFIEAYRDEFAASAGKGGNNLSGKEFQIRLTKWQEDPARKEAHEQLQQEIHQIIEQTKQGTLVKAS